MVNKNAWRPWWPFLILNLVIGAIIFSLYLYKSSHDDYMFAELIYYYLFSKVLLFICLVTGIMTAVKVRRYLFILFFAAFYVGIVYFIDVKT
ncbi:hypothetical protein DNH61_15545 [Paenibacillus sambharensis]|uniref:Uncharacterized protein n=1 Tax=Paenibacillus sambharensis TaxID=1803190 RepID=A0A2W1L897_9BACL|nr:hypothetical protein DNH61_15545 [Paenibacillus sambharensis]